MNVLTVLKEEISEVKEHGQGFYIPPSARPSHQLAFILKPQTTPRVLDIAPRWPVQAKSLLRFRNANIRHALFDNQSPRLCCSKPLFLALKALCEFRNSIANNNA